MPSSRPPAPSASQPPAVEDGSSHVHAALATVSLSDCEAPDQTIKSNASATPASASTSLDLSSPSTTTATETGPLPSSAALFTASSGSESATVVALDPPPATADPSALIAASGTAPLPRRPMRNMFMLPPSGRLHPNQPPGLPRAERQWTLAEALVGAGTAQTYPLPRPQQFIPLETAIAMGVFGDDPHGRPPLTVGPSEQGRQAQIEREAKRKQAKEERVRKREERWKEIEEERKKKADERKKSKQEGTEAHYDGQEGMEDDFSDCNYSDIFAEDFEDYLNDMWEDVMEEECV